MSDKRASLSIDKLKIQEVKHEPSKELDAIVKLMAKHGTKDAYSMLPQSTKHHVSFVLNNTYSAFANAIRRTLVEDIPTKCMSINEKDILTDDEFISGMNDVLVKNLGLVPIMQFSDLANNPDKYDVYLSVFNNTNDIIDVKVRDIHVTTKKPKGKPEKKKFGKSGKSGSGGAQNIGVQGGDTQEESNNSDVDIEEDIEIIDDVPESLTDNSRTEDEKTSTLQKTLQKNNELLAPDDNILLMRLRPGKFLKLRNITIVSGTSAKDAGKFSLLNNIYYKPLDIQPYDQFTNKGTRSIEHDCKSFELQFTTCGNIMPREVMNAVHAKLSDDLADLKKKITLFASAQQGTYYSGQDCEVTYTDEVYNFKFNGHYISELMLIAMCCYRLDETIPFCTATVERFDSIVGIVRIKHADATKLLLKAIDVCQADLDTLLKAF